ncbi:MAG: sigma-70 family RNA polymerase sigma factor [Taibaiella sp.]|nr:sigma-70 family RNA polymerase sigma factor [Taibaiella sp.]
MYSASNNEQQLLKSLAKGERVATELVYKQQYPVLNGWLLKNGCSADDAADIFQEAMMVLFGKVQEPEFRLSCNVGTYIFAVGKHLWYKKLQQLQKAPVRLFDNTGEDGDEAGGGTFDEDLNVHHEREAHFELLDVALQQIGEPCKSLLEAYYHKDKSMQEIAVDFGYTNPENAKTQKYKCLTRLKKLFYSMQAK